MHSHAMLFCHLTSKCLLLCRVLGGRRLNNPGLKSGCNLWIVYSTKTSVREGELQSPYKLCEMSYSNSIGNNPTRLFTYSKCPGYITNNLKYPFLYLSTHTCVLSTIRQKRWFTFCTLLMPGVTHLTDTHIRGYYECSSSALGPNYGGVINSRFIMHNMSLMCVP